MYRLCFPLSRSLKRTIVILHFSFATSIYILSFLLSAVGQRERVRLSQFAELGELRNCEVGARVALLGSLPSHHSLLCASTPELTYKDHLADIAQLLVLLSQGLSLSLLLHLAFIQHLAHTPNQALVFHATIYKIHWKSQQTPS